MDNAVGVVLSPAGLKSLNKGKKRKANITEWKDNKRRILRQTGKGYVTRKGQEKPGKQGPLLVSGKKLYVIVYFILVFVILGATV